MKGDWFSLPLCIMATKTVRLSNYVIAFPWANKKHIMIFALNSYLFNIEKYESLPLKCFRRWYINVVLFLAVTQTTIYQLCSGNLYHCYAIWSPDTSDTAKMATPRHCAQHKCKVLVVKGHKDLHFEPTLGKHWCHTYPGNCICLDMVHASAKE